MSNEEAQIIARTIGLVAKVSAEIVVGEQLRNLAPAHRHAAWDQTLAEGNTIRSQAIKNLGDMLARSCYGTAEAIDVNKEIISRLERITNDQKTVPESSQSAG